MTQGGKVGQLSLAYGANDMGSVMIEENVVRAAGAEYCMDEFEVVRNIESAGFTAKRRTMHYEILGDPIFRERAVPRMLELAVAREDGRAGEADDLRGYAARSAPAGEASGSRLEARGSRLEARPRAASPKPRASSPRAETSERDTDTARPLGAADRSTAHRARLGRRRRMGV